MSGGIPNASGMGLSRFWTQTAFSADHTEFQWLDVAVAAMVRGDWSRFERRLTEGLAAVARGRAENVVAGDEAVDAAMTAFRYERDLISGDEMNTWLDREGLDSGEWSAYFSRALMRERFAYALDETIDRYIPSSRQLREAALAEGVCSGSFDHFAQALARCVALVADARTAAFSAPDPPPDLAGDASRLAHLHGHWLEDHSLAEIHERFVRALHIERAFAAAAEAVSAGPALHAMLGMRQMEWTRLALQSLTFTTEDAAREAIFCVRLDGLSLDEVGLLARQAVQHATLFVEDVRDDQRVPLLSADIGRVVGPLPIEERFQVLVLTSRTTPSIEDGHVRERARLAAIEAASERAARDRIAWRPRG